MTIVRTPGRKLFIHSPTRLTASLEAAVAQVGTPRWLIGLNRLHSRWLQDWAAAYPDALVYAAPGGEDKMSNPRGNHRLPLNGSTDYEWEPDLATLPVAGRHFTEIVFFHRNSRTLILTDLIENFEVERLDSCVARVLTLVGGVRHPDGQMPRDMRRLFALPPNRNDLRLAVEKMIGWAPGACHPRARPLVRHRRGCGAETSVPVADPSGMKSRRHTGAEADASYRGFTLQPVPKSYPRSRW